MTAGPNSDPELDKGKKPVCVPVTQNDSCFLAATTSFKNNNEIIFSFKSILYQVASYYTSGSYRKKLL